jgi:hypothetical protein
MAPEQARGEVARHDERTDIYALGGILYEILTLQGTVQGTSVTEILGQVADSTITEPRKAVRRSRDRFYAGLAKVPRELNAICMKALAKAPGDRYARVSDLLHDIDCWRNHLPVAVCPDPPWRKARKWCARHPVTSGSILAVLATLLIAGLTIGVARELRFRSLVASGNEHREQGTGLFGESLVDLVKYAEAARGGAAETAYGTRLRRRIDERRLKMDTHYDIASVFYAQAARNIRDLRVRPYMKEIQFNRLRHAMLTRDGDEIQRRLGFIREWAGANFEHVVEDSTQWLNGVEAWANGNAGVDLGTLMRFTEEERGRLKAAGVEPQW